MKIKTVIIIFLIINLFLINSVSANPVAVDDKSGSPIPLKSNKIHFYQENVTYIIDKNLDVQVTAHYYFKNIVNETVNITIWLPFTENHLFDDFLTTPGYEYKIKGSYEIWEHKWYYVAVIDLSFEPYEIKELPAIYTSTNTVESYYDFTEVKHYCEYLSKTGSLWNNTIDTATFTFKIHKDRYVSGITGFDTYTEEEYIVATITYDNWSSDHNIIISWKGEDRTTDFVLCISSIIIVLVLIILFVVFLIRKIKKDEKKYEEKMKSQALVCEKCKMNITTDYNLCPYCGYKIKK